ncbi:endonuclease/exonuclease/phosphatase family protein [Seonamhaeicola marinus]|uniref:Endonuclease/exonuclease/phosphatase family protein n=1 Tax=Seonamhaeicola marinus TaxID=1912246 RepID=A0A5D0HJS4_9FLAO|nr:endonuclease/exonuclease/phosphatase family protein [Seonamhaeicola marinus]TYA71538.1 endonuclease/exonuclease/phosphatase family protein [Seonamhaeicola marinus]
MIRLLKTLGSSFFTVLVPIATVLGVFVVHYTTNFLSFVFSILFPLLFLINVILLAYLLIKRNKKVILPAIAAAVFLFNFNLFFQKNSSDLGAQDSLSILTYNTRNFQLGNKEEKLVDFVKTKKSDIVLFQEFSAIKYHLFKKEYPYWIKTNQLAPHKSVLAFFSKYPIINSGVLDFLNSKNNGMFADVNYKNDTIRIYNLHLESFHVRINSRTTYTKYGMFKVLKKISHSQKIKEEQVKLVKDHMNDFDGKILVCGDFNSTQYSSAYLKLKEGKKDTFIEKGNGLGTTYSLNRYPLRLDYILVDEDIEVLSHKNYDLNYSDHEPVFTELKLN